MSLVEVRKTACTGFIVPGNQYDTVLIRYDPIMFEVCNIHPLALATTHPAGPSPRVQSSVWSLDCCKRARGVAHRQGSC